MTSLDQLLEDYIDRFLESNRAAKCLADGLDALGVGLRPLVDHCTVRTHHVDHRARQFVDLGYAYDARIGVLEFNNWWAKVYRKPGYPALFIDQAFDGDRGKESLIPDWVNAHGDQCFHHIAVSVDEIEAAIAALKRQGFEVAGDVVGGPASDLRQVFTQPEMKHGRVFSVLELIERHNGYEGFLPPQADGLMESTRR